MLGAFRIMIDGTGINGNRPDPLLLARSGGSSCQVPSTQKI
jgi:hypothetical protein